MVKSVYSGANLPGPLFSSTPGLGTLDLNKLFNCPA